MADRAAIENVLASWALGYDEREVDRMERCFTEDAEMILDIGAERMGPYVGRAEVMKHFTDHHAVQTDQRRHVVSNVVVEDTDGGASVTSYLTLVVTEGDSVELRATGVYRDQFVAVGSEWRIRRRHLKLDRHY